MNEVIDRARFSQDRDPIGLPLVHVGDKRFAQRRAFVCRAEPTQNLPSNAPGHPSAGAYNGPSRSQPPESNGQASSGIGAQVKTSENRCILAVDDDSNVTDGLKCNLRAKFTLVTASGGLEALEHQGPFAVVVSDLRMPGMDGIELLRRIRETYPETIRIMLSGNADTAATVQAVNSGGIHHLLLKPTPVEELRRVLEQACAAFNRQAKEQALALEDPLLGVGSRRHQRLAAVAHRLSCDD